MLHVLAEPCTTCMTDVKRNSPGLADCLRATTMHAPRFTRFTREAPLSRLQSG